MPTLAQLSAAIQAVRDLHHRDTLGRCSYCTFLDDQAGSGLDVSHPCDTIQALNAALGDVPTPDTIQTSGLDNGLREQYAEARRMSCGHDITSLCPNCDEGERRLRAQRAEQAEVKLAVLGLPVT